MAIDYLTIFFSLIKLASRNFHVCFINFFEVINNVDQLVKYDTVRTYPICPLTFIFLLCT